MSPQRARLIGPIAGPPPAAGNPGAGAAHGRGRNTLEPTGTSHFIIRDAAGNVVSMTTTVEIDLRHRADGRRLLPQQPADRFLLLAGRRAGPPGRQRRRAGQAPALVDGAVDPADRATAGSPARSARPAAMRSSPYVAKSLVAAVDWNEPMHRGAGRAEPRRARAELPGRGDQVLAAGACRACAQRGIDLKPGQGEDSGLTGVLIRDGRIDGGADPRREGVVLTLPR